MKSLEIQLNSDCSEELLLEIILRSRISWYEHGEKSSKHFLNLKKRNKSKSQIRKILSSDNGREYNNPEEIMNELKAFLFITTYWTEYKV